MESRIIKWWGVGIILVVWLIFSSPYLFKGLAPFPSDYLATFFPPWNTAYSGPVKNAAMPDVITQIYPWKKLVIDAWKQGEIPLWNPFSFSGTTLAGNYQSAAFTPINILFLFLPFVDAWSWSVLLQPLLAGLGMYLYLSLLVTRKSARLIGSVAFMFSGFMVVWMAYGTLGHAILVLPWVLYGLEQFQRLKLFRYLLISSGGVAYSFLAGHFQMSIYILGFNFLYAVFIGRSKGNWKGIFVMLFMIGVGVALAAPQILSSYATYLNSSRVSGFGEGGEIIPIKYLLTIIAPDIFGNPVTRNDWFGHYAEWSSYIGVAALIVGLFYTFGKKETYGKFYTFIFIICLIAATTPIIAWLRIPALSTSASSRIIVLSSFALSVLASFGWERLLTERSKDILRNWSRIGLTAIFSLGVLWWSLMHDGWLMGRELDIARRNLVLPTGIMLLTALVIWLLLKLHRWRRLFILGFLMIVVFDSLRFAGKWQPFAGREYMYPEMPVLRFLEENIGYYRVFGNIGGEVANYFRLPVIEGYDAVYNQKYGKFISAASDGNTTATARSVVSMDRQGQYTPTYLKFLGVKYIIQRKSDGRQVWAYPHWKYPERYKLVYSDESYEVYEDIEVLPRAYFATSVVVRNTNKDNIFPIMLDSGFLDGRRVVIESNDQLYKGPMSGGEGTVEIINYKSGEVELETQTTGEQLLFMSDVNDGNWKAYVNSQEVKLYQANYVFRAVVVPQGAATVKFVYRPRYLDWSVKIVGMSFGALILLSGIYAKKGKL